LIAGQSVDYPPDEYIDYLLCKTFHYLPSQLDREDDYVLQIFLKIMALENEEQARHIKRLNSPNYG